MQANFLVETAGSCVEWVVALAFVIVGATVVRKAESRAGLLVIAAGGLWLLGSCCTTVVDVYTRGNFTQTAHTILMAERWVSFLVRAAATLAFTGGAIVLARAIVGRVPAGGAR